MALAAVNLESPGGPEGQLGEIEHLEAVKVVVL
jgi:hypothetical protein